MAQAQGGSSSFQFKDPFDLLSDLHNARFQFLYKNEFARGSRPNMREVSGGGWGGGLPSSRAQTRLPVNAPVTNQIGYRGPTARNNMPPARQLVAQQNFGTPELQRNEVQRMGKVAGPLISEGATMGKEMYQNYKFNKQYGGQVQKLYDLEQEQGRVADLMTHMEDTIAINKNLDEIQQRRAEDTMLINKNLSEMRERQRQSQAQTNLRNALPGVTASVLGERGNPANMLSPTITAGNRAGMQRLNTMESQNAARFANEQRIKSGGRTIQDILKERSAETFAGTQGNIPYVAEPTIAPKGSAQGMLAPPIPSGNQSLLEGLDKVIAQRTAELEAEQTGGKAPKLPPPSQMPSSPAQAGKSPTIPVSPNPSPVPAGPTSPFPQPPVFNKESNTEALGGPTATASPAMRPTSKPSVTPKPAPQKPKGKTPKKK